jgi:hypothetical protein
VAGLALLAFESRNRALDALSRSMFATDRVIQSVSGSLTPGEARSNLLASSCDLLDSLRDGSQAAPRTHSLVLCAVERAESRDRLGEGSKASDLIETAIRLAEDQFAKRQSADDALAVLTARRAALERAIASGSSGSQGPSLAEFITRSRQAVKALTSERDVPEYAAQTLQTAAVSLAEKKMTDEAVTAIDAAIELGQTALDRGADLSARLDHVTAVSLKSKILRLRGELPAAARAKTLLSGIRVEDAEAQGLGERLRQVADTVGRPAPPTGQKP